VTTWAGERVWGAAFSNLYHLFWTYALSSAYSRDTAVELNGGRSFTAASSLTTGLSAGGVIVLAYNWLDPQRTS
jgi:hypothetical protein